MNCGIQGRRWRALLTNFARKHMFLHYFYLCLEEGIHYNWRHMSKKDKILVTNGVFPGQHAVDLNLTTFSSAGHSCWMSSRVEGFASRAAFSSCAPGWERLRNAAVSAPVTEQRQKHRGFVCYGIHVQFWDMGGQKSVFFSFAQYLKLYFALLLQQIIHK